MKQDETKDQFSEASDTEQVEHPPSDALRKVSEIEQIDDSQLPQSIKEIFRK
jgi:hypothetical protein